MPRSRTPSRGVRRHFLVVEDSEPFLNLLCQEEIASDAHGLDQREVLVDGFDSRFTSLYRVAPVAIYAIEKKTAFVRRIDTAENLGERRFPGSVVTDERRDFPAVKIASYSSKRVDLSKALLDVDEFDDGPGVFLRGHSSNFLMYSLRTAATMMMIPVRGRYQ